MFRILLLIFTLHSLADAAFNPWISLKEYHSLGHMNSHGGLKWLFDLRDLSADKSRTIEFPLYLRHSYNKNEPQFSNIELPFNETYFVETPKPNIFIWKNPAGNVLMLNVLEIEKYFGLKFYNYDIHEKTHRVVTRDGSVFDYNEFGNLVGLTHNEIRYSVSSTGSLINSIFSEDESTYLEYRRNHEGKIVSIEYNDVLINLLYEDKTPYLLELNVVSNSNIFKLIFRYKFGLLNSIYINNKVIERFKWRINLMYYYPYTIHKQSRILHSDSRFNYKYNKNSKFLEIIVTDKKTKLKKFLKKDIRISYL